MSINDLRGEQRRQLIDTQQVFDTWRQTQSGSKTPLRWEHEMGETEWY